jgi:uncharacterized protein (DUF934 family)
MQIFFPKWTASAATLYVTRGHRILRGKAAWEGEVAGFGDVLAEIAESMERILRKGGFLHQQVASFNRSSERRWCSMVAYT